MVERITTVASDASFRGSQMVRIDDTMDEIERIKMLTSQSD